MVRVGASVAAAKARGVKLGLTGPPLQTVRDSPPTIPDHELVRRIGQGAYGEVWLARNAARRAAAER